MAGTAKAAFLLALVLCAALLIGCERPAAASPPTAHARDLTDALQRAGLHADVVETAALPRVRGDGLRLLGRGLEVEVYAIADAAGLQLAARAAGMAAQASALQPIVRAPYLVIVRQEPRPGQVAEALARIPPA